MNMFFFLFHYVIKSRRGISDECRNGEHAFFTAWIVCSFLLFWRWSRRIFFFSKSLHTIFYFSQIDFSARKKSSSYDLEKFSLIITRVFERTKKRFYFSEFSELRLDVNWRNKQKPDTTLQALTLNWKRLRWAKRGSANYFLCSALLLFSERNRKKIV